MSAGAPSSSDPAAGTVATLSDSTVATSVFAADGDHQLDTFHARAANWRFATQVVAVDSSDNQYGASSTPIFQTATFKGMDGPYDYTRSGNPTRGGLESHLARLYGANQCFALSTGMTCLDVILRLVKPGETVLAGDDLYGGTNRLLTYAKSHGCVDVRHVDTTDVNALTPHLGEGNKVKMVLLESPTNPLLKIADIAAVSAAVHAAAPDAIVVVDNTMMSPYLQRPLELGADIVYDSATKYLSGHHDLMAGIIAVGTPELSSQVAWFVNAMGSGLAPFDSFLLMRGVKTLALRMDKQQANAQIVADYLHALGFLVHYPGLKSHPKADIHWKQASGAGSVLSFVTGDKELSERIVSAARLWGVSVSFGAVNSLISMPCLMSHASISAAVRAERGLPEDLIRLCLGIEDPRDLLDDLEHALIAAGAIEPVTNPGLLTGPKLDSLFLTDTQQWALERAKTFRRPGVDNLIEPAKKLAITDSSSTSALPEDIVVSAPGKVIMFGEHAVVHGVTAIATSLSLRCYGVLTARSDHYVAIDAPDLEADFRWEISHLPWDAVPALGTAPVAPTELDPKLLAAIEEAVHITGLTKTGTSASIAFLYLYMALAGTPDNAPAVTLTVSANLPIGAGLGSSAAFSAVAAAALLIQHGYVSKYDFPAHEVDLVDAWSFVSEKVLHGNPSGIDNAVSVRGGAVAFTRAVNGRTGGLDGITDFGSIRLLLTNTKVPRDTKSLVAGVAAKKAAEPTVVEPILEQIQAISDEARDLLDGSTPATRAALIARLEALMRENHTHLRTLGVSHPSLEAVVACTAAAPFGLTTKLTGAGGGGCAVTLIPDVFPDAQLGELLEQLRALGAEPHLTTLGGPGLGVFRCYAGGRGHAATLRTAGSAKLEAWSVGLDGKWEH